MIHILFNHKFFNRVKVYRQNIACIFFNQVNIRIYTILPHFKRNYRYRHIFYRRGIIKRCVFSRLILTVLYSDIVTACLICTQIIFTRHNWVVEVSRKRINSSVVISLYASGYVVKHIKIAHIFITV